MWDFLLGFSCWDILWDFSAWDFPAGIFSGILQLGFFAGIFVSDILETSTLKHEIFWDISITLVTETCDRRDSLFDRNSGTERRVTGKIESLTLCRPQPLRKRSKEEVLGRSPPGSCPLQAAATPWNLAAREGEAHPASIS